MRLLQPNFLRAIHADQINEHGGLPGVRDEGLLESVLSRPGNALTYKGSSLHETAACYGFGLATRHCFFDGNKRVVLIAIDVFLDLNGVEFLVTEAEAVDVVIDVASGNITESDLAEWIKQHMFDPNSESPHAEIVDELLKKG